MRNQVKLPVNRIKKTLADLKVGEETWTVPLAIVVDRDRNMWINTAVGIMGQRGGPVQLLVKRCNDGFEAHLWFQQPSEQPCNWLLCDVKAFDAYLAAGNIEPVIVFEEHSDEVHPIM